jgi:hypothetical protein
MLAVSRLLKWQLRPTITSRFLICPGARNAGVDFWAHVSAGLYCLVGFQMFVDLIEVYSVDPSEAVAGEFAFCDLAAKCPFVTSRIFGAV